MDDGDWAALRAERDRQDALARHRSRKQDSQLAGPMSGMATPRPGTDLSGADLAERRKIMKAEGLCLSCGQPIGEARKAAHPDAEDCIDCAREKEECGAR